MAPSTRFLVGVLNVLALAPAPGAQRLQRGSTPVVQVSREGPRLETLAVVGTPRMFNPATLVANLDAGDQVAGRSWLEMDGVVFVETFVGFHWSPLFEATPFDISADHYYDENIQTPREISENGTVVGVDWFTLTGVQLPFRWTRASGFDFLPTPGLPWIGSAEVVSADGTIIGGFLRQGPAGVPRAVRWNQGALEFLSLSSAYSTVRDMSRDGRVLVGEAGPDEPSSQAVRWIDGVLQALGRVPGETASKALLSSDDGARALGVATVNGSNVLVSWDSQGVATPHSPPQPYSVHALNALTPDGAVAVGELSTGPPWAMDWTPFAWRDGSGFQVLGELGRSADYDRSRAVDVSDDGQRVVGHLQSSVVSNGDPPQLAVLWFRSQTVLLDELLAAAGLTARGLFSSVALSGDGHRIVATGLQGPSLADSGSILITLQGGFRTR